MRLCQLAAQAGLVHSRWRSGAVHCHCWGRRDGRRRRCCSYARWRGWPGCRGSWFVGSCRPRCRRQRLRSPVARRPVQLLLTKVACACSRRSRRSRRTRQGAALNDDLAQRLAERCLLLGAQAAAADRQWVLGQRGPQHLHSRESAGCSFLEPTLPLASRAHTHSSPPGSTHLAADHSRCRGAVAAAAVWQGHRLRQHPPLQLQRCGCQVTQHGVVQGHQSCRRHRQAGQVTCKQGGGGVGGRVQMAQHPAGRPALLVAMLLACKRIALWTAPTHSAAVRRGAGSGPEAAPAAPLAALPAGAAPASLWVLPPLRLARLRALPVPLLVAGGLRRALCLQPGRAWPLRHTCRWAA